MTKTKSTDNEFQSQLGLAGAGAWMCITPTTPKPIKKKDPPPDRIEDK